MTAQQFEAWATDRYNASPVYILGPRCDAWAAFLAMMKDAYRCGWTDAVASVTNQAGGA